VGQVPLLFFKAPYSMSKHDFHSACERVNERGIDRGLGRYRALRRETGKDLTGMVAPAAEPKTQTYPKVYAGSRHVTKRRKTKKRAKKRGRESGKSF